MRRASVDSAATLIAIGAICRPRVGGVTATATFRRILWQNDPNPALRVTVGCQRGRSRRHCVTALAEYDIEASVTGGFTSGLKAEAPGDVQILVRCPTSIAPSWRWRRFGKNQGKSIGRRSTSAGPRNNRPSSTCGRFLQADRPIATMP